MIDDLQSSQTHDSEAVIAVRITGKLSRDEMMGIAERIERALAEREKVHIYAELSDFHGFDWTAMGEYLPRALKMLGQRERFGRIAVVTDLAWIRWATRLESAVLPGLSYETYTMAERDQALAWVEGRSPYSHQAAFTLIETGDPDAFGFELDGRICAEEMHELVGRIDALLERRDGKVRILGKFKNFSMPAFAGIDADYVRMKLKALDRVERYAVVGGPLWLSAWIIAMAPLLKIDVRHFPADQEDEAWSWLGASPRAQPRAA
jgi:SpoIIAA-like